MKTRVGESCAWLYAPPFESGGGKGAEETKKGTIRPSLRGRNKAAHKGKLCKAQSGHPQSNRSKNGIKQKQMPVKKENFHRQSGKTS